MMKGPQGDMEIKTTLVIALPGSMRQDMMMPMGTMSMVVTPEAAFMTTPQGEQPMPASMRERVVKELARTPLLLLRQRNAAGFKATATGAGKSGDTAGRAGRGRIPAAKPSRWASIPRPGAC